MRHALLRAEGFIIITGQPGMGKTTLIDDLLRSLRSGEVRVARENPGSIGPRADRIGAQPAPDSRAAY